MSTRSGAIRQPAGDGSSFDLSKHSPEQIAQLFARWKEQRKRLARDAEREPGQDAAEQTSAPPQVVRFTPAARPSARPEPEPQPPQTSEKAAGVRRYSADFSAILTSGDRATAHRVKRLRFPAAVVAAPARPAHGAGMRWTLAIAVSFIALTAAAGAAYWSQHAAPVVRPPTVAAVAATPQPEPVVERPLETQTAAPFLPAATRLPEAEPWSVALLVDPASGSPLASSPSVVEVAQEPLSANHKSIQTTGSPAIGPSVPMAQVSAEVPGDFVTSAGGSSPAADTAREAAPPMRQAADSAGRGNQRDRLRLDPGTAPTGSTIDRNGSAIASQGENDPSGNGTAGGGDVGSSANAGSSGGASASGSDTSSGASSHASGSAGSASANSSGSAASSGSSASADGDGSSSSGNDASSGASSHAGHKGGGNSTAKGSDAASGASSDPGGSVGGASAGSSGSDANGSGANAGASGDSDTGTSAGGTGTSGSSDGNSGGPAGGLGGAVGGAVDGAVGGVHDAIGGALGGMGKPADGIGKPDGKGKGASAGGKAKGKDKDKGGKGGKGGGKGKG